MKGLPIFWTRMAVELIPMSLYTHTLRVLPTHFGRETVPSGVGLHRVYEVHRRDTRQHHLLASIEWMLASTGDRKNKC